MKTFAVVQPMLAASGSGTVNNLFSTLMVGLACLVVWAFGRWLIPKFGAAPVAVTIWDAICGLVAVVLLVNFLLGLAGRSMF